MFNKTKRRKWKKWKKQKRALIVRQCHDPLFFPFGGCSDRRKVRTKRTRSPPSSLKKVEMPILGKATGEREKKRKRKSRRGIEWGNPPLVRKGKERSNRFSNPLCCHFPNLNSLFPIYIPLPELKPQYEERANQATPSQHVCIICDAKRCSRTNALLPRFLTPPRLHRYPRMPMHIKKLDLNLNSPHALNTQYKKPFFFFLPLYVAACCEREM